MTDSRPPLVRGMAARGALPDPGTAAGYDAAREVERLLEMLLDAAPQEQAVQHFRLKHLVARRPHPGARLRPDAV